jgi:high-affinity iron transporter
MFDLIPALPAFIVTLREGFEAALVVGIVLACLEKAQQHPLKRWVYQGTGGGIVASLLLGSLLAGVFQEVNAYASPYQPILKDILATLFSAIAIGMLSWMLIWMTQQARSLKAEIEGNLEVAIAQGTTARRQIFLLVFIAVVREGFETVLFISAQAQENAIATVLGAIAGLLAATSLGFLLFKWGVKINIRQFFQLMGIFLLLIVAGLVIGMLKHLDASLSQLAIIDPQFASWCIVPGESCLLGDRFWDLSNGFSDSQFPGILLKSLLGYRDRIYWGQAIAYGLFITIIGGLYARSLGIINTVKSHSSSRIETTES